MLTIGQVAKRMKMHTSTIRYYEHEGLIPETRRESGKRIYDESIFDQYVENLEKPFPLMFRLAKATGLRIYELATFPAAKITAVSILFFKPSDMVFIPKKKNPSPPINPNNNSVIIS